MDKEKWGIDKEWNRKAKEKASFYKERQEKELRRKG